MEAIHLKIDGSNVKHNLKGRNGHFTVYTILNKIPDLIDMTKMIPEPIIWEVKEGKGRDGSSGIMPIKESQITIHTFSDTGEYYLDVFSCKDFNVSTVVAYLQTVYSGSMKYGIEMRGNTNFKEGEQ